MHQLTLGLVLQSIDLLLSSEPKPAPIVNPSTRDEVESATP